MGFICYYFLLQRPPLSSPSRPRNDGHPSPDLLWGFPWACPRLPSGFHLHRNLSSGCPQAVPSSCGPAAGPAMRPAWGLPAAAPPGPHLAIPCLHFLHGMALGIKKQCLCLPAAPLHGLTQPAFPRVSRPWVTAFQHLPFLLVLPALSLFPEPLCKPTCSHIPSCAMTHPPKLTF